MKTVVGLFDRYQQADIAVHRLREAGFSDQQISVVARKEAIEGHLEEEPGENVAESAAVSAIGGGVAGGIIGLLVGLGAIAVPGIGLVFAAGTLATALGSTAVGAGIGAAGGGLLGALISLGMEEEEAEVYAESVKRGGILILVHTEEDRDIDAATILTNAGAVDVDERRSQWEEE